MYVSNTLRQGMRNYILHLEDCSVCYQNADQEISQHGSFSYNIHSAIHLYLCGFYALPDP